jgi:predicted dehydrogenase
MNGGYRAMVGTIRVGFVGVSAGDAPGTAGWSYVAHLPAIRALPGFAIGALSSRSRASAETVAREYGVTRVYDDATSLAQSPDVDLVAVTVRVPAHLELTETALAAGKAVLCEWPLGNGLAEAKRMAAAAKAAGKHCVVGLQARLSPAILHARQLIADGYIGEVLSTTMTGAGMNWGPGMLSRNAYTLDKRNGATLLTIPFGHAVDALCHCLGEFDSLVATSALRRPEIAFADLPQPVTATAEDQWAVSGTLTNGAVASIHYRGGYGRPPGLWWEINGTQGDLRVSCDFGHAQIMQLRLQGAQGAEPLADLTPPDSCYLVKGLADPALNVGQLYAAYAADLKDGGHRAPTFDDAVVRHRMLEAIETAAATGTRQRYPAG